MMDFAINFLENIYSAALQHGVDPLIFMAIYIASIPIFYYALFRIVRELGAKKKSASGIIEAQFANFLILGLAWLSPYCYILVLGRDLPLWIYVLIFILVLSSLVVLMSKLKSSWRNNGN